MFPINISCMCTHIYTYMQKHDMRPKAQSSLYIYSDHSLKSCVPGPGVQRAPSWTEKAFSPAENDIRTWLFMKAGVG